MKSIQINKTEKIPKAAFPFECHIETIPFAFGRKTLNHFNDYEHNCIIVGQKEVYHETYRAAWAVGKLDWNIKPVSDGTDKNVISHTAISYSF